jgi:phage repressor protein C with HTH and peptisase S24 domain
MSSNSGKKVSVVKIRFNLKSPVSATLYNYLQAKEFSLVSNSQKQTKIIPIQGKLNFDQEPRALIPLYDFYAAAGTFSEMQSDKDFTLIEIPENLNPNNDYFSCKIIGESMNRVIPNGSICLFKTYTGGSRNGKIVLVENMDIQDPDFNSAFTIKTYSSEKIVTKEGWRHSSIILSPNSFDDSYKKIIINEETASDMRVVGEFVKVL